MTAEFRLTGRGPVSIQNGLIRKSLLQDGFPFQAVQVPVDQLGEIM